MLQIRNLDKVAQAYDQRCILTAFGRFLVVLGVPFAAVGAWPPANIDFFAIGIGATLQGILIVLPFRQPRARWIAMIGGGIAFIIALLLMAEAVIALLPSAQIVPPVPMDAAVNNALSVANTRYSEPPWMIARSIGALLTCLMAIELFMAGWFLARLDLADCRLLVERSQGWITSILTWLLELPPGILRYMRGALFPLLVMIIGMFIFLTAATNIAGASGWQNFWALSHIIDCVDNHGETVSCVDEAGITAAKGMAFLALASFFVLPVLGRGMIGFARRRSAINAANRLKNDSRAPILFLRAFEDDQVELLPPAWTPMRYVLSPTLRLKLALDYLLLGEFMDIGPPRALGRPEEKESGFPPFGAVRVYVEHDLPGTDPKNSKWRLTVKELAEKARKIVIVFDANLDDEIKPNPDGLNWELIYIGQDQNKELRAKTVILAHPCLGLTKKGETADALLQRNRAAWIKAGRLANFRVPDTNKPLLGLSIEASGATFATTATRFSATTVLLALRVAFFESV